MTKALAAAIKQLEARDVAGVAALLDAQGALAAASGNALLAGTEEPLRVRVKFLSPTEPDGYDWDALVAVAHELQSDLEAA